MCACCQFEYSSLPLSLKQTNFMREGGTSSFCALGQKTASQLRAVVCAQHSGEACSTLPCVHKLTSRADPASMISLMVFTLSSSVLQVNVVEVKKLLKCRDDPHHPHVTHNPNPPTSLIPTSEGALGRSIRCQRSAIRSKLRTL
jgi:hypothetical protein